MLGQLSGWVRRSTLRDFNLSEAEHSHARLLAFLALYATFYLDANGNELMRSTDHEIRHNQALWDADVYKRQCEHEARLWG